MTKSKKFYTRTLLFSALSTLCLGSATGIAQDAAAPNRPATPEALHETAPQAPAANAAPELAQPPTAESAPGSTQQPATGVAAQAEVPAPAVVAAPAPTPVAETAAKPTEPTPKDRPSALALGEEGSLKLSGLLQVWGVYQHQTDINPPNNDASTLRLRRAELKFSGELLPKKLSFGVMIDAAKLPKYGKATVVTPPDEGSTETGTASVMTPAKDNSLLQDVSITYHTPWFDLSAGQFKTPLSYESATSSSKLMLPERASVVRAFGEQREMGIKLEKKFEHVGFVLGAYNGSGINTIDSNMQKDVALRLEAYPFKGMTIGAVGYTSVGQRDTEASTKDRVEGDLALQVGDFLVQGEYIHGWDGAKGARVEGAGWYGALGYTIAKLVQPVVRVGQLDKNVDTEDDTSTTVEAGVNCFAYKDAVKLQVAYIHTGFQASGANPLSEVILAGQYKY